MNRQTFLRFLLEKDIYGTRERIEVINAVFRGELDACSQDTLKMIYDRIRKSEAKLGAK